MLASEGDHRQGRRQEDRRLRAGLRRSARATSRRSTHVSAGAGHTVGSILVPLSATDFTPYRQQVKQQNADLLFVAWAGHDRARACGVRSSSRTCSAPTTIATGLAERATWRVRLRAGEDQLPLALRLHRAEEQGQRLAQAADEAQANQAPDIFTPDGFVAAQMIVRAVQKGGGDDVDKMITALEGWQFVGPKGPQRIRPADHAMLQPMFQVQLRQNGSRYSAVLVKTFSPGNVQPPVRPFPS